MPNYGVDPGVPQGDENGYVVWFPSSDMIFVNHHFTPDFNLFPGLAGDAEVKLGHLGIMINTLGTWSRDDSKMW